MEKDKKLATEPYKGVRDFYPEDMFIQKYIFSKMRETVEKFGFVEYGASVLEPAELYKAKSGEEIVNEQTYTFIDRGEREVTLRPEMTPTVARMVAAKRRELGFPLRWYSIPNLFRYEQPQRGRVREHWQLNVDLFGSDTTASDVEIISVAYEIMKSFGAKDEDFQIHINHRALLKDLPIKAIKLLDRKNKISEEQFTKEWSGITDKPFEISANEEIQTIISYFEAKGIKNIVFAPTVVRGFDYYTGMVFEVFDTNTENRRSLFGGGRYDNLTELFGGDKIPAIGFGMGDVTIRDFLEIRGLLPTYEPSSKLFIAIQNESFRGEADSVAQSLRAKGIAVTVDVSTKKVGDQIKTADKQHIPYVIVIGEEEAKSHIYKLKNLSSSAEITTPLEEIARHLTSNK